MNKSSRRTAALGLMALLLATVQPAAAGETLKVCAADNEMPYANTRGDGFEDRISAILAGEMGVTVERVGFSDPRYVVRDLLDKGKCDVLIGVDYGDPRLETTRPYYLSNYVFVTRARDHLDVKDWNSPALRTARIGVIPGTPAETMLVQIGRYPDSFPYLMALGGNRAPRNRYVRYDVEKLIGDVGNGTIDVAVAWLPSVARYIAKSPEPLTVSVVPQATRANGDPVIFQFETSVGVRKGDTALLERVQGALDRGSGDIQQVLVDEGIKPATDTSKAGAIRDGKGNG